MVRRDDGPVEVMAFKKKKKKTNLISCDATFRLGIIIKVKDFVTLKI